MIIDSKIEEFDGADALSVSAEDCEGFGIQQYVELPDIPAYADSLIKSMKLCFTLLDMDSDQIEQSLRNYSLL